jgi:PAS domain S-box-containing protein
MFKDSTTDSRLYRLLVEDSLGLMCIHDLDGVLLRINLAAAESLGYSIEQGLGRNLGDFLAPSVHGLFGEYLRRIRANGKDSGLLRLRASNGSERIWMYRNILHEPEGSAPLVLGHALDITDRIQAELALKEAKEQLRNANEELARRVDERTSELQAANQRLRGEIEQRREVEEELIRRRNLESLGVLAGGIAHDFNNFLTVVQGNVSLARMDTGMDAQTGEILDEIMTACERAARLTSQLLTFSKGGAPVRRVASVAKVILDAVALFRSNAAVSVTTDIASNLWSAEIDPEQIGQVLQSVLLNAREAMPAGGIIEVTARNLLVLDQAGGKYVRISIRDYGCGIPPEVLPRVFDPYFTTKSRANGLGLTSAYSIVQKHGGRISISSESGSGTLVTVDLVPSPASVEAVLPAAAAVPIVPSSPWKLLVMDDEESILRILKTVLTSLGHEVSCARDGADAIALYEAARAFGRGYDAVLLDLTVKGGMGGIDAAARLREMGATAKLIVSSGYSDSLVLSDFRAYGFDDVIRKPWTPEELTAVFDRVLADRAACKRDDSGIR